MLVSGFPSKGHEDETEHVKGGDSRREQERDEDNRVMGIDHPLLERARQDLVLAIEPGEEGNSGDGQCPDHHRDKGHLGLSGEAAHVAHILLVVESVDDRTGAEEQERLEECMGGEVKQGGAVGSHPQGGDHVSELT